jgi:multidrug efflux pump subunit AcrB
MVPLLEQQDLQLAQHWPVVKNAARTIPGDVLLRENNVPGRAQVRLQSFDAQLHLTVDDNRVVYLDDENGALASLKARLRLRDIAVVVDNSYVQRSFSRVRARDAEQINGLRT